MTREELNEIVRTLPGVFVRWGIARDLPGVMALERATLGDWDEREMQSIVRRNDCVLYVAECGNTQKVRGFLVYMSEEDATGCRLLRVLNMTAGDPLARAALINRIERRAEEVDRELVWNTPSY
jgi:hypothetical protein